MTESKQGGRERRDFFRISQDILFEFKPTEAYRAENEQPEDDFDEGASMGLIKELKRLDRDNQQVLKILGDKNRLLGDYLASLNNKIDLLVRHSLFGQDPENGEKKTRRINVSEDGISFLCERALYVGSYVAVRMVFLPSYTPISSYARILRCQQSGEASYQIAAKFHRLDEKNRQDLSRMILRAQVATKKQLLKKKSS